MKTYRCTAQINAHISVEAESLTEAIRIVDGVLQNVDSVVIVEGEIDDPDDELIAIPGSIHRGELAREQ